MDIFSAHRINALSSVMFPGSDPGYELRRIFRWYSTHFCTPLHEVSALPLDDVLQNYFEAKYEELEDLEPDEKDQDQRPFLTRERDILSETEAERKVRVAKDEDDKHKGDKLQRMVEQEQQALWKGKAFRSDPASGIQAAAEQEQKLLNLAGKINKMKNALGGEQKLADMEQLPPVIQMEFEDDPGG